MASPPPPLPERTLCPLGAGPCLAPPPEQEAPPRMVHLRCCCRCSSDTRKKKRRLLLVRNSWRRLLSVRSGMLNSSFSVGEAESWAALPVPGQLVPRVTHAQVAQANAHLCTHTHSLTCQTVPEVGQADLLGAKKEQGAL